MDAGETVIEKFAGFEEVMKVGSGKLSASGAITGIVDGIFV